VNRWWADAEVFLRFRPEDGGASVSERLTPAIRFSWSSVPQHEEARINVRHRVEPSQSKRADFMFALNEDRPLFAFACIWTTFNGDRGTKSKPIPGPHQVYGVLTTATRS
jgi:putative SOS response-associated peptidase YedK